MTSNWKTVRLGDVAETRRDSGASSNSTRYVGLEHLATGNPRIQGTIDADAVLSSTTEFSDGDVLFGKLRPYLRKVAKADFGGCCTNEILVWRPSMGTHISRDFLALTLQSSPATEHAVSTSAGSRMPRTSAKLMGEFQFPLPPRDEQQRIVDLIQSLDDAIEAADDEASSADRLWWEVAKGLEQASSHMDHVPLGEIADISGGLTKNKKDFEQPDVVEVPYLRVANVHRRYLDLSEVALIKTTQAKIDRLRLLPGDIVMNEGGDKDKLGRGAIWRGEIEGCIHQNHVFRVRLTSADFTAEFVSHWSNSFGKGWFETFGTQTTGIASISKSTLSRFPVPTISRSEQSIWVGLLDSALSMYNAAKAHAEALRKVRAEMLSSLLSGAHTMPETYDAVMKSDQDLVTA